MPRHTTVIRTDHLDDAVTRGNPRQTRPLSYPSRV